MITTEEYDKKRIHSKVISNVANNLVAIPLTSSTTDDDLEHYALSFESFSKHSYPEQFIGASRVKCLAQGHINRFFT
jgi:hypothetical protein